MQFASSLRLLAVCAILGLVCAQTAPAVKRLVFEASNVQNYSPGGGSSVNGYRNYFGYTDEQIRTEMLEALNFYHTQFGIPNDTYLDYSPGAIVVPGYGTIVPIEFNTSVSLVHNNVGQGPSRLGFAEVPFFVSTPFEYGGAYRQFLNKRTYASPADYQTAIRSTTADFYSYGWYIVRRTGVTGADLSPALDRKWRVRTLFPANARPNGIFAEVTDVFDTPPVGGGPSWGRGETSTIIQSDSSPSTGKYLTKMKFDFTFPEPTDRVAFVNSNPATNN